MPLFGVHIYRLESNANSGNLEGIGLQVYSVECKMLRSCPLRRRRKSLYIQIRFIGFKYFLQPLFALLFKKNN